MSRRPMLKGPPCGDRLGSNKTSETMDLVVSLYVVGGTHKRHSKYEYLQCKTFIYLVTEFHEA